MLVGCLAANAAWLLSNGPSYRLLSQALGQPRVAQQRRLFEILRRNASSEYGRRHRFGAIRTVEEYQNRAPIVTYEAVRPDIEETIHEGRPILTSEPVLMVEKTSGSASGSKYIPYTRRLLREFQRGIGAWLYDLYRRRPGLMGTRAYWSISPIGREAEVTRCGIPVGFGADTQYLRRVDQAVLAYLLVLPQEASEISDVTTSRYVTLRYLLDSPDLGLVSVWNPSFFSIMLRDLPRYASQLADDISHGRLSAPTPLSPRLQRSLERRLRPRPRRADEVRQALAEQDGLHLSLVWPRLQLLSCWASGPSARFAAELRALLPKVEMQGKGLLASEGLVTIPLSGYPGGVVAVTSHFYEFKELESGGRVKLVDELETGGRYSVILTTGGGLYRYDIEDEVRVVGRIGRTPLLEFVGRLGNVSDLCGEKLTEGWVRPLVQSVLAELWQCRFAMLAPEWGEPPFYVLFLEAEGVPEPMLRSVIDAIETRLGESYHYAYCRRLGQLGPLRGFRVAADGEGAYLRGCEQLGQRGGAVKQMLLHPVPGWSERFEGAWVAPSAPG